MVLLWNVSGFDWYKGTWKICILGDLKSGEDFILGFNTYIVLSNISNSMGKLWVMNKPHFLFTDLEHLSSLTSVCLTVK